MKFGGTLISGVPHVTVDQLITVLCQFPPDRRVVVSGQEWCLSDVGDISSRRLAFSFSGDKGLGCWIPKFGGLGPRADTSFRDVPSCPSMPCCVPCRRRLRGTILVEQRVSEFSSGTPGTTPSRCA
jgi:hypothetical protein